MKAKATIDHVLIQRMIIISLGLLTYAILLTSCTYSTPCSAYDCIEQAEVVNAE